MIKGFNVDSCFVFNAINLQREINRDETFGELVKNHENIYEYYKKNKLPYPELLRYNFFSRYTDKEIEDGNEVRDFWRVHYYYHIIGYCKKNNINLCISPVVYNEITFNRHKPETKYKDFRLVNSNEFKDLFTRIVVDNVDYGEYLREREDLVQKYFDKGIMMPTLDSRTGKAMPSADMRVMADGAIMGNCVITSDNDYISETHENDMARAKRIKNTNERCGYVYTGSNGISIYPDWIPVAYEVSFLCKKLEKSSKLLSFSTNPNLVSIGKNFKYQLPLFDI